MDEVMTLVRGGGDLTQEEIEAATISILADGETVPPAMLQQAVQRVFKDRHKRETSSLLNGQYRERSGVLRKVLNEIFDAKSAARTNLLSQNLEESVRSEKMRQLDDEYAAKREAAENDVTNDLEEAHMEQQITLRQQQMPGPELLLTLLQRLFHLVQLDAYQFELKLHC